MMIFEKNLKNVETQKPQKWLKILLYMIELPKNSNICRYDQEKGI